MFDNLLAWMDKADADIQHDNRPPLVELQLAGRNGSQRFFSLLDLMEDIWQGGE